MARSARVISRPLARDAAGWRSGEERVPGCWERAAASLAEGASLEGAGLASLAEGASLEDASLARLAEGAIPSMAANSSSERSQRLSFTGGGPLRVPAISTCGGGAAPFQVGASRPVAGGSLPRWRKAQSPCDGRRNRLAPEGAIALRRRKEMAASFTLPRAERTAGGDGRGRGEDEDQLRRGFSADAHAAAP
jgi:hypothetical protein